MKKLVPMFVLVLLCMLWSSVLVYAKEDTSESYFRDNGNGTVTIIYNNNDNAKMKVGISKDKNTMYYNLFDGKNEVALPMTAGNGTYQISIYKNIAGTKYRLVASTKIELNLVDENSVYLQSYQIVDWNKKDKAIKKAAELAEKTKDKEEMINKVYTYLIKNFTYDYVKLKELDGKTDYIPDINYIYMQKTGICYDIASLMASMLRSLGIETKLVTGYTPNVKQYHAWNQIYNEETKKWITVDPTYDICMYAAGKAVKMKKAGKDYSNIVYIY